MKALKHFPVLPIQILQKKALAKGGIKSLVQTLQTLLKKTNTMKNNKLLGTQSLNTDVATLLLRLIFGGLLFYHGYDKIDHYHLYLSMSKSIIGLGAKMEFSLVIFAEFFCGFLIIIGLFTRLAVIPLIISFSVAFFIAHAKDAFMVKELAFLFLLLCIPVFILGSGKFSVDRLLFKK